MMAVEVLPPTAVPLSWDGPVLVGRDAELAQVLGHLEAGVARVVGVAAGPSLGKTLFLGGVERAGRDRGWLTARRHPEAGSLTITSSTTEEELVRRVRELLDLPGEAEADRVTQGAAAVPPARRLVLELATRGPSLLLIDDFRPTEAVRDWLTARFLPELRQSGVPVVAVVAGLPDAIEPLRPVWDDVVFLGPLPERAVRAHFESVGAACRPPLSAAEIDAYVEDSLEKPHVLNALTMLLAELTTAQAGVAV